MKQCPVCEAWCFEDMPVCYNCMYAFQGREHAPESVGAQVGERISKKTPSTSECSVAEDVDFEELFAELDEVVFAEKAQEPTEESAQLSTMETDRESIDGLTGETLLELDAGRTSGVLRIEVPLEAIRAWAV